MITRYQACIDRIQNTHDEDTFQHNIPECDRCGEAHNEILAFKLATPIPERGVPDWTHWTLCPSTLDPVLVQRNES